MKTWKIITTATLALVTIAILTASAYAYLYRPSALSPYGTYPNGMMGNYGYNNYPSTTNTPQTASPTQTQTPIPTYPSGGLGWGCRGGRWGWNYGVTGTTSTTNTAITLDSAVQVAKNYVASLNNPDLIVIKVGEYTQNFHVIVTEKSTGKGAFELVVDKYTGSVGPEMGPTMMWNTKYEVRNGICGWLQGAQTTATTVTLDQANTRAQEYLNANYQGTAIGTVTEFYGYYQFEVVSAGNTYGMLSVNAYTGQVFFHTWHGAFVQEWAS